MVGPSTAALGSPVNNENRWFASAQDDDLFIWKLFEIA